MHTCIASKHTLPRSQNSLLLIEPLPNRKNHPPLLPQHKDRQKTILTFVSSLIHINWRPTTLATTHNPRCVHNFKGKQNNFTQIDTRSSMKVSETILLTHFLNRIGMPNMPRTIRNHPILSLPFFKLKNNQIILQDSNLRTSHALATK